MKQPKVPGVLLIVEDGPVEGIGGEVYRVRKPFYMVKDKLPYGHGEKSVLLLQRFIDLKIEEVMAIRWHMGGFTPGITDYSISQAFSEAASRYPLIILLHMADMKATYLKENVTD